LKFWIAATVVATRLLFFFAYLFFKNWRKH